jgi:hypothetical protein
VIGSFVIREFWLASMIDRKFLTLNHQIAVFSKINLFEKLLDCVLFLVRFLACKMDIFF